MGSVLRRLKRVSMLHICKIFQDSSSKSAILNKYILSTMPGRVSWARETILIRKCEFLPFGIWDCRDATYFANASIQELKVSDEWTRWKEWSRLTNSCSDLGMREEDKIIFMRLLQSLAWRISGETQRRIWTEVLARGIDYTILWASWELRSCFIASSNSLDSQ